MGTFYQCSDNSVYNKDDCVGTYTQTVGNFNSNLFTPATTSSTLSIGLELPRTWVLPDTNFDHLGSSLLTLFKVTPIRAYLPCLMCCLKVAALNQWSPIMYQGIDAVGEDLQPQQNNSPVAALFFIIFVFVGALFIFQLFISVIISVYHDTMSSASLTDENAQSNDLERLLDFYLPDEMPAEPTNKIRQFCYNITTGGFAFKSIHRNYETFIMICIILNIGFMLSKVTRHHSIIFSTPKRFCHCRYMICPTRTC
jgi:hypothetical protein